MPKDLTTDQNTTVVSVTAVLGKLLEYYGLDVEKIAEQVGIDTSIAYKPSDRISVAKIQKVWNIALEETGDDSIGLTYATLMQPACLNGLGLAWIASETLADSIKRLIRFQHSISTALDFLLVEEGDYYKIIMRTSVRAPMDVSVDASVATIFQMCKITYGPELRPAKVCFSHQRPSRTEPFDDFFGVQVEFNSSETQIVFSKKVFEKELYSSNPELARMNDDVVIKYLKQFDKKNISLQVRAQIIEVLGNGMPQQEKIASQLNMSLRNLQRKLKSEGTNYKSILDETRSELSKQYLRGSDRPIIEVGFLLGFSEPSNFARAFRRWSGVSPLEYRQTP
ncbi:MAG: AraC family transcriptional regulator [Thiohalomonadales bacterium]